MLFKKDRAVVDLVVDDDIQVIWDVMTGDLAVTELRRFGHDTSWQRPFITYVTQALVLPEI